MFKSIARLLQSSALPDQAHNVLEMKKKKKPSDPHPTAGLHSA